MLLLPLAGLIYAKLNHNNGNVHILVTALDKGIPFVPFFVIPYLAFYAFIFLILFWFLFNSGRLYFLTLFSIFAGFLICFVIYGFFQTTVPRPIIAEQNVFLQLTGLVYRLDNPYNAFPSIHVLTSSIIFLGSKRAMDFSQKISRLSRGMTVLIILSTLFLKQHTIIDLAGGLVIGAAVFKTVETLMGLNNRITPPAAYSRSRWDKSAKGPLFQD